MQVGRQQEEELLIRSEIFAFNRSKSLFAQLYLHHSLPDIHVARMYRREHDLNMNEFSMKICARSYEAELAV